MARIGLGNSGKFASSSGNDFFTLENDQDSALVSFLYDDPEGADIDYFLVHEVQVEGKRRYVNCNALDDDGERMHPENCPLCENGYPRIEKLFLQLYNHDSEKVETWDRGRTFVPKITTYVNRYKTLVNHPFEIVRNGKKGDSGTTYEFIAAEETDATLETMPEKQDLLGPFILDVNADDMFDMLDGVYKIPGREDTHPAAQSRQPQRRQASSRQAAPAPRTARTSTPNAAPAPRSAAPNTAPRTAAPRTSTPATGKAKPRF